MKRTVLPIALPCLLFPSVVMADDFTGFSMDFVDITGGNVADNTGYGAVGYDYRMGVNEVSRGMIDAYNANSGGPVLTMSDMTSFGGNGANRPATGISWNEAARFVNWLNTSSGFSAAYNFTTGGFNDNITLWGVGDAGYDPGNPFRNSNAYYFLPSEDEWYRAAYYDPNAGAYWDYATGSDSAPTAVSGGTTGAVYGGQFGPADVTNAGGLSPFGTMGQNGNVLEWAESGFFAPNESAVGSRVVRGGDWEFDSSLLVSSNRYFGSPTRVDLFIGFRVASVPEPSGVLLEMRNFVRGGSTVTVDIFSNAGNVDVYRTTDLIDYGATPVAQNLPPGTGVVIDDSSPEDKAFYILVPHGSDSP